MAKRVLYAEDEYSNRKIIEFQLQNLGISCDLASDGTEAIEMIRRNRYDLIILDRHMPGAGGDVVATIAREVQPQTRLMAITSDDDDLESLRRAGFCDVFIKPLRGKMHLQRILSHLGVDG